MQSPEQQGFSTEESKKPPQPRLKPTEPITLLSSGSKSETNSEEKILLTETTSSTGLMSLVISINYCFDQESKSVSFKTTGVQREKIYMMASKKTCSFALWTVLYIFLYFYEH